MAYNYNKAAKKNDADEYDPFGGADPFAAAGMPTNNGGWSNPSPAYNPTPTYTNPPNNNMYVKGSTPPLETGGVPPSQFYGAIGSGDTRKVSAVSSGTAIPKDFSNEPPLLEELGINFEHIYKKTLIVLIPTKKPLTDVVDDADMAGPLVFCMLLGFTLLLRAKLHFGYIFGFGLCGAISLYVVFNLMSQTGNIDFARVCSILGYCLLPVVLLAFLAIFFDFRGFLGFIVGMIIILWCSITATRFFEAVLNAQDAKYLIMYPVLLLYSCFTLIAIF